MSDQNVPSTEKLTVIEDDFRPSKGHHNFRIITYGLVGVFGLAFFGLTTPTNLPLPLLLLSFIIIAAMAYSLVGLVLSCTSLGDRLSAVQRKTAVLILVILPILLLMLQSIGQLTVRDVVTLSLLFGIGMFYFDRITRKR